MGADHDVRCRGDARSPQEHLGDLLVHASGTGQHPAADVGKAHHLQHALDGPVLAVGPVQQRQDDIDLAQGLRPRGAEYRELASSQGGAEPSPPQALGGDGHRGAVVAELEGSRIVLDEQPLALGRDTHRKNLVAVTVDG